MMLLEIIKCFLVGILAIATFIAVFFVFLKYFYIWITVIMVLIAISIGSEVLNKLRY